MGATEAEGEQGGGSAGEHARSYLLADVVILSKHLEHVLLMRVVSNRAGSRANHLLTPLHLFTATSCTPRQAAAAAHSCRQSCSSTRPLLHLSIVTSIPCRPCCSLLQAKLQQHSADMEKDAARARSRLEQLKQALARVQHQQQAAERRARSEAQQVTELGVKQQEYARSLDKCARKLAANGVTPEVR